MKKKNKAFRTGLMATLLLGALGLPLLAQQDHIGKKVVIRLSPEVRAGEALLQPGSYQIQHVDHAVIFRKMLGYKDGTFTSVGKEVARVPCEVELLGDKIERTEIHMGTDPAGNRIITELRLKGENVRHFF